MKYSRRSGASRRIGLALLASAALVVAGCGGSDGSEGASPGADTSIDINTAVPEEIRAAAEAAEAKGLRFVTSREELMKQAEEEASLFGYMQLSTDEQPKILTDMFHDEYPFAEDLELADLSGNQPRSRLQAEIEAGQARDVDIVPVEQEAYAQWLPYVKSWDIYGMAEAGILDIPLEMIDPQSRTVVAFNSSTAAVLYNKDLIAEEDVPDDWFGFLDPRFSRDNLGMVVNLEATNEVLMVPTWGIDRTLEYARGIAAQNPIWTDSQRRGLQLVQQGEAAVFPMTHAHAATRTIAAAKEAGEDNVGMKIIEPTPLRSTRGTGITEWSEHPHVALLWLEFVASDAVQKALNETDPPVSSYYSTWEDPSSLKSFIGDREVAPVGFEDFPKLAEWLEKIQEAWGFPTAESG